MWAKILTCTNITLFMPTSVICQREAMSTWPSFELMLHTNKSIALTLYVLASTQRVTKPVWAILHHAGNA